jgi:hypothetical protein
MTTKRIIEPTATDEDFERFWAKVDKSGDCWLWTGSIKDSGYGYFWWNKKRWLAHRWLYIQLIGMDDQQMDLDHTCHNDTGCKLNSDCPHRRCVNPAHLEPVTHVENCLRGDSPLADYARKTHCPKGHEYTEENTRVSKNGGRACRECHRTHVRNAERQKVGIPLDVPVGAPRFKAVCSWGHARTPENLYPSGKCRLCTKRTNDAKPRNGLHNVRPKPTVCPHGHDYTPENTYVSKTGSMSCKACRKLRSAAQAAKRKAAK